MLKYLFSCVVTTFLIVTAPFNLFMPVKKVHAASFAKTAAPKAKTKPAAQDSVCTSHILNTEEALGLPSGMLLAVSIVETGVGGKPNPYSVHKKGRSYYAKTPAQAKALITNKDGSYIRNTSVGCMQLQTTYHHRNFKSFNEMVSPEANVRYGGNYLKRHYKTYGNWSRAVRRYNGGKAAATRNYLCKVHNVLKQIDPQSARLLDSSSCGASKPYVSQATLESFQAFYS